MGKRIVSGILGFILIFAASWIVVSVSLYALKGGAAPGFLLVPGAFLYERFLHASYYLGVYLLVLAYLSFSRDFQTQSILFLLYTLIPFVTAAVLFHVAINPEPNTIVEFFILGFGGRRPGSLILLLFLIVEILLGYRITMAGDSGTVSAETDEDDQAAHASAGKDVLDDGLFPERHHEVFGNQEAPEVEELPALAETEEDTLLLDRDSRGRLRFSVGTGAQEEEETPSGDLEDEETRDSWNPEPAEGDALYELPLEHDTRPKTGKNPSVSGTPGWGRRRNRTRGRARQLR